MRKYYIAINEKNEITGGYIESIHKDIPKNAIEVTESIWKQRLSDSYLNCYEDGKLIKKDFATDEQKEQQRIQGIKSKAQSIILEKYPLEKQSSANLGLYGEEYLAEMKAYIANIIRISNEAELNGTILEDLQWQ